MLKLLKNKVKPRINYKELYTRLFDYTLAKYNGTENKEVIKQLSYYGVKAVNEIAKENLDYEQTLKLFELTEVVKTAMSLLTPNELITVFPVDKKYDGRKYQSKDYFYTMNELENIGMNNTIFEKIGCLLWDYVNVDTKQFLVNSLCALSAITRIETGKSFIETWAEENNIETYKLYEDLTTNQQYLYNPKTGRTTPMKNAHSYLKLVK